MSVTQTTTTTRTRVRRPAGEGRVSPLLTALRLLGGWAVLGVLAWLLWTPGSWAMMLLIWVGLTILADEFGGWFGYMGALLGGLPFFAPGGAPDQWTVVLPLVGGALLALLLVKHSGGLFVLPFAGAVYLLPLLALGQYGTKLDPSLTLPGQSRFQQAAVLAMVAGLAFSFVRQLIGVVMRVQARRRAARAAAVQPGPAFSEEIVEEVPETTAPAPAISAEGLSDEVIVVAPVVEPAQKTPGKRRKGRHR